MGAVVAALSVGGAGAGAAPDVPGRGVAHDDINKSEAKAIVARTRIGVARTIENLPARDGGRTMTMPNEALDSNRRDRGTVRARMRLVSVIYVVLPLSILLAIVAVILFVLAVRRGQFDDLETPGVRVLLDDDPVAGTHATDGAGAEAKRTSSADEKSRQDGGSSQP